MEIENLLDEIEDLLESSWKMPMSGGKVLADATEIRRIIEDIHLKLPKEIIQAKKIVTDRTKIIEGANSEAETIIKVAEEKIRQMITKEEVVKAAQNSANEIISGAKTKAKEVRIASSEYAENIMSQLDKTVTAYLTEIRKGRQALRSSEISMFENSN